MTVEEKAKAYDEALKKASVAHKDEDRHLKATLERIFPELKRSEDEKRLRKTTIAFLKDFAEQGYENAVECINWLEKQDY